MKSRKAREIGPILLAVIAAIIFTFPQGTRADTEGCPKYPDPITKGFRAYEFRGVEVAVTEWTYQSAFAGPDEVKSLVTDLSALRETYGEVKSYRSLGGERLTPNTWIAYYGAGHERGMVFFKFIYYCEKDAWILSERPRINADPDLVISQQYYSRSILNLHKEILEQLKQANVKKGR